MQYDVLQDKYVLVQGGGDDIRVAAHAVGGDLPDGRRGAPIQVRP